MRAWVKTLIIHVNSPDNSSQQNVTNLPVSHFQKDLSMNTWKNVTRSSDELRYVCKGGKGHQGQIQPQLPHQKGEASQPCSHRCLLWYGSETSDREYPGLCRHFSQFLSYWQCQSVCSSLKKKEKNKEKNSQENYEGQFALGEAITARDLHLLFYSRKSYQNPPL